MAGWPSPHTILQFCFDRGILKIRTHFCIFVILWTKHKPHVSCFFIFQLCWDFTGGCSCSPFFSYGLMALHFPMHVFITYASSLYKHWPSAFSRNCNAKLTNQLFWSKHIYIYIEQQTQLIPVCAKLIRASLPWDHHVLTPWRRAQQCFIILSPNLLFYRGEMEKRGSQG